MTKPGLIATPCPVCRETASSPYAEENGFALVRCGNCGLLYVTPRPDPAATAAAHEYGVHQGDTAFEVTGRYRPGRIAAYRKVLADAYGHSLPATITSWLDIGCGHGEFLMALRQAFGPVPSLVGIELNVRKAAGCLDRGLDVRTCGVEELNDRYSAISLLNVFSHLQDPKGFLASCVDRLLPGGELLVETGDTAHLPSEDHPRPLYLPDHLLFGNEAIARRVLTDIGLEVISVHKYPAASAFPWPVLKDMRAAFTARRMPRPFSALRQWMRERRRRIDMYIRAKRIN